MLYHVFSMNMAYLFVSFSRRSLACFLKFDVEMKIQNKKKRKSFLEEKKNKNVNYLIVVNAAVVTFEVANTRMYNSSVSEKQ